jgi:cell filamentation protein
VAQGERYRAEGIEAQYEPGSRGRVLRNRLGIRSVRQMAMRESEALLAATQQLIDETRVDQRFTALDSSGCTGAGLAQSMPGQATTAR